MILWYGVAFFPKAHEGRIPFFHGGLDFSEFTFSVKMKCLGGTTELAEATAVSDLDERDVKRVPRPPTSQQLDTSVLHTVCGHCMYAKDAGLLLECEKHVEKASSTS